MEIQQINELIKHPELLGENTLIELRSVLERYPYFQTAWILYLKNLFLLNHSSFKDELRRGSLYVADLSVLFYYIEGNRFVVSKHHDSRCNDENGNGDRTLDLIDRFLSELSNKDVLSSDLPLPIETTPDYTSILLKNDSQESSVEAIPMKGQSLIDSFIEKSDSEFSDQLLSEIDSCKVEDIEPSDESVSSVGSDTTSVSSGADTMDEEEYLTETLAKIYVKQQRYDKALEIIKKLYLKYPKKNAYFADQIRFLEKLIINAKSK